MQELQLLPDFGGANNKRALNKMLKETHASFGETLNQTMHDVSALQGEAGKAAQRMASGEATDMHEVMIAFEDAKTSFELLMEIRNKMINAYREIMRMQV